MVDYSKHILTWPHHKSKDGKKKQWDRRTERDEGMKKRNNTWEGRKQEIKWQTLKCSQSLHCLQLLPAEVKFRRAAGSKVSTSCTGGLGEPACTKLMGNCSVRLLLSLEQGLEGGGGGPWDGRQHGVNQMLPSNNSEDGGIRQRKIMFSQTTGDTR